MFYRESSCFFFYGIFTFTIPCVVSKMLLFPIFLMCLNIEKKRGKMKSESLEDELTREESEH